MNLNLLKYFKCYYEINQVMNIVIFKTLKLISSLKINLSS